MNIFVLDNDVTKCAQSHCDKHVVKMILESAQLLSSAVRMVGIDAGYSLTHQNHPCAVWTRLSIDNWRWLLQLTNALNDEYKYRYGKITNHKSWEVANSLPEPNLADIGKTAHVLCMPDEYKDYSNPVESYRAYYMCEKSHIFNWTKREAPGWLDV